MHILTCGQLDISHSAGGMGKKQQTPGFRRQEDSAVRQKYGDEICSQTGQVVLHYFRPTPLPARVGR